MPNPFSPLVFLHAYPLNSAQWDGLLPGFRDRHVLAPNLPGFGGRPAEADTLEDFAAAVIRSMDAAGVDRAVIIGLSMGGYVALRLHARWPERVAGLVLADTRAGADSPEAKAKRTALAERARTQGLAWLPEAFIPDALGETTRRERPQVVERVRAMVRAADPEGVARALLAMRDRPDSLPDLPSIAVPVLALAGEEDTLTPVEEARTIAEGVPRGTLHVLPGAGHLSNLENPDDFTARLREFLDSVEPMSGSRT
jgi:pimeloyl-ACP methyl ester carboxylesterase